MNIFIDLNKKLILLLFVGVTCVKLSAQIVNDSTVNTYGRKTTKFIKESDVYYGGKTYSRPDTSIYNFHNYDFTHLNNQYLQNLGHIGTPSKTTFFSSPQRIGFRNGYTLFDAYVRDGNNHRYIDSRSPYTDAYYVQGIGGDTRLFAEFSRNISRFVNAGVSYQRLISQKQIDQRQQRDRQVDSEYFMMYFSAKTPNDRYQILANFYLLRHNAKENGGEYLPSGTEKTANSWINSISMPAMLQRVRSFELRDNFKLYQQYDIFGRKEVVLFHSFHWENHQNALRVGSFGVLSTSTANPSSPYRTPLGMSEIRFISPKLKDSTYLEHTSGYENRENVIGLKSHAAEYFISGYFKQRYIRYNQFPQSTQYMNDTSSAQLSEWLWGAELIKPILDSNFILKAKIENLIVNFPDLARTKNKNLGTLYKNNFDYLIDASIESKWGFVKYKQSLVSPSFFFTQLSHNSTRWENFSLKPTFSQELIAFLSWKSKYLELSLNADIQNINNYIYLGTDIMPTQEKNSIFIASATPFIRFNLNKVIIESSVRKTHLIEGKDVIRFPEWLFYPKIYFQSWLFNRATYVQIGFEGIGRTNYKADAYSPALQQFFLQDKVNLSEYWVVNFFANLKIKNIRLFFKLSHLNQGYQNNFGYYTTPNYPGMRFTFQFGFNWLLFD